MVAGAPRIAHRNGHALAHSARAHVGQGAPSTRGIDAAGGESIRLYLRGLLK